ncbi:putative membrane metalloprotease ARASP2, chloroplastic isoform X2 [Curcuma longa]|uniref:putative membrane metalloprotease ARASP2, chloroplastic isoform X2 n=1 Tax=Curcuma longa TaxID=136217 RepID=UPI003D9F3280
MITLSASAHAFILPRYPKLPLFPSSSLVVQSLPSSTLSLLFPRCRRRSQRFGQRDGGPHSAHVTASLGGLEGAQPVVEAASVLAGIILVHEAGHFFAATLQGIRVSKFAVGFGPVLARFVAGGVEYSLRAFPLGGFVGFPDDDPDSDIPPDDADLLKNRPVLDRLIEALPGLLVPEVRTGSAAARDGLLPGDIILEVNGETAPSLTELVEYIKMSAGKKVAMKVVRKGAKAVVLSVTPDENADGAGRIGVQLSPNFKLSKVRAKNLAEATIFASREFVGLASTVLDGLKQTFLNFSQSASKVSGPVAIIAVGAEVARSSSDGLFQFAAVINLNLAVINLLPLPALDGGSLALILLEAARGGRKIPREVEQRIMSSGILFVVMLGLFLIVRDTLNLDFIKEML